jgi:hypothetical protein
LVCVAVGVWLLGERCDRWVVGTFPWCVWLWGVWLVGERCDRWGAMIRTCGWPSAG